MTVQNIIINVGMKYVLKSEAFSNYNFTPICASRALKNEGKNTGINHDIPSLTNKQDENKNHSRETF